MIRVTVSLFLPSVVGSFSSFMVWSAVLVIELSVIQLLVVADSVFTHS